MDAHSGANLDSIHPTLREVSLLHHLFNGQFHSPLDICRCGSFVPGQDIVTLEYDSYSLSVGPLHDVGLRDLPSVFVPPTSIPITQEERLGGVAADISSGITEREEEKERYENTSQPHLTRPGSGLYVSRYCEHV